MERREIGRSWKGEKWERREVGNKIWREEKRSREMWRREKWREDWREMEGREI